MHTTAVEHAHDLPRVRLGLEGRDALVARAAQLVHEDIASLQMRYGGHFDPTTPHTPLRHAAAVRRHRGATVPQHPLLERGVRDLKIRVRLDERGHLPPERACRRAILQAVAQRVEETRAVARLADHADGATRQDLGRTGRHAQLPLRRRRVGVLVLLARLLEPRAERGGVLAVALVARELLVRLGAIGRRLGGRGRRRRLVRGDALGG
mmetsp:Transcript_11681/g.28884  ORF Transcript_11681/g.28884 Transcript_11681/m.28884 type:complete len:209 (+) Transcript_11681:418-1044(+)